MRIAWFSPLPPTRSGIADYSRDVLPFLQNGAAVQPFASAAAIAAYPAQRWQFDIPIYHIGNSPHHADIYAMLQQHPGIVVLHDVVLHHFMAAQTYGRELSYAHGTAGLAHWHGHPPPDPFAQPLNRRVLDLALGVIMHSAWAAAHVQRTHPDLPLAIIPMPIPLPKSAAAPPRHALTFGAIGQITPAKQIDLCLAAFAQFAHQHPAHFSLIGEAAGVDVPTLIAGQKHVTWHGYIDDYAQFETAVAAIDIMLNLRNPTAGETSAAALRALALGKPVIVIDHGWYSELPDSVAVKIKPDDRAALVTAMAQITAALPTMQQAAVAYIATDHDPAAIAQKYIAFAQEVTNRT